MKRQERIKMIDEAIHKIQIAQSMVYDAIADTGLTAHFEAYGCYGINTALGNGNPYDSSLETLKTAIDEMDDNDLTGGH